jgi:hypothetical protein
VRKRKKIKTNLVVQLQQKFPKYVIEVGNLRFVAYKQVENFKDNDGSCDWDVVENSKTYTIQSWYENVKENRTLDSMNLKGKIKFRALPFELDFTDYDITVREVIV